MKLIILKNIALVLLCFISMIFIVLMKETFKENETRQLKMVEIIDDVKLDSVFDTKYVVKIKRLEIIENEYYLHTNKQLKPGFIYSKDFFISPSTISYKFKLNN